MATPRRYSGDDFVVLLWGDKPPFVASDAHFASALQKVQVNLTFHSLIRIFMVNHEDTHARCEKFK